MLVSRFGLSKRLAIVCLSGAELARDVQECTGAGGVTPRAAPRPVNNVTGIRNAKEAQKQGDIDGISSMTERIRSSSVLQEKYAVPMRIILHIVHRNLRSIIWINELLTQRFFINAD